MQGVGSQIDCFKECSKMTEVSDSLQTHVVVAVEKGFLALGIVRLTWAVGAAKGQPPKVECAAMGRG